MMKNRRDLYKGNVGKANFLASTKIESELFSKISYFLYESGVKYVRRVHDAIYTTEDVENINYEVRRIVDEYCAQFIHNAESV